MGPVPASPLMTTDMQEQVFDALQQNLSIEKVEQLVNADNQGGGLSTFEVNDKKYKQSEQAS